MNFESQMMILIVMFSSIYLSLIMYVFSNRKIVKENRELKREIERLKYKITEYRYKNIELEIRLDEMKERRRQYYESKGEKD